MITTILFLVLVIMFVTFLYAYRHRTLAKMSLRNAIRRKIAMLLIVAGSLTGTAFIVGSFVINDSFQNYMYSGLRNNVGRIDEVITPKSINFNPKQLDAITGALSKSNYVDAVLPVAVKDTVAVLKGKLRSFDPHAISFVSFIGVDLKALRKFGEGHNFPNVNLTGNEVVIGQALANALNLKVGETFQALSSPLQFFFGVPPTFKIVAIVPQKGILGYKGTRGFTLPIFLSLEQVKHFFGTSYNQVLVANRGNYLSGARYTKKVDEIVKRAVGDTVKIDNIKANQIRSIENGQIGKLFLLLSSFAILAGALLLVNIYTMLADERKSDLGTLRAIGFSRRKIEFILYFEGFIYSIVAAFIGSFVGIFVAWLMISKFSNLLYNMSSQLSDIMSIQNATFTVYFNFSSIIYGFALGMIIPLIVLVYMVFKIGRLNIVHTIRDIPEEPKNNGRKFFYVVSFFFALFVALAIFGNRAADAFTMYTGVIGSILLFPSFFRKGKLKRIVGNFAALGVIIFAFTSAQIPYVQSASENSIWFLGLKSFSILVSALFFLSYNFEIFDKMFALLSRKSIRAAFKLAIAEISQNKRRTGMTIAMYAIVIFVITFMTIVPYSQVVQVQSGNQTIFRGYDAIAMPLFGKLNITQKDISKFNFLTYHATASMISVRYAVNSQAERQIYQMIQMNEKFLNGSNFKIAKAIPGIKNKSTLWKYLQLHPGSVVAFGLPRVSPGNTVEISKEGNFSFNFGNASSSKGMEIIFSGPLKNPKKFKVVATFENDGITAFPNGFYTTPQTVKDAFGNVKSSNFLLVKLAGKTEKAKTLNFEKFLAFLKTRFSIGLFSKQMIDVFANMIKGFVSIINSFLYFGLSVGILGLAILMFKTLQERRRTIGILKSIGFTRAMVFSSFFIETNFVVIFGILTGFISGTITSYMIYSSLNLGKMFIPWLQIIGLDIIFYVISIFATLIPTDRASKLPPAEVLRYYE